LERRHPWGILTLLPHPSQKRRLKSSQKLHWLDLSRNWLQELPPEIENLTELEWLGLGDNDFKGVRDELFEREPREIMRVILARQQPLKATQVEEEVSYGVQLPVPA